MVLLKQVSTPDETLPPAFDVWRQRRLRAAALLDAWVMSTPSKYAALAAGGAALAAAALHPLWGQNGTWFLALGFPALLLLGLAGGIVAAVAALVAGAAATGAVQPEVQGRDVLLWLVAGGVAGGAGAALREIARLVILGEARIADIETRFRSVVDSAPVLIWVAGPDKGCSWFNRPWLEFTGRTVEQEHGFGWSEGVHRDDLQRCLDTYTGAFEARRPFRMEYRLRRYDGEYRWVDDTGVPYFTPGGGFLGYTGACVDIHDRKSLEARLLDSEKRFTSYADHTSDCLWAIDAQTMQVEYLSPGFEKIWKLSPEALKTNLDEWASRIHPDDRDTILSQIPRARKGQAFENEYRILRGDGEWRWLNDMGVAVRDGDGEVVRLAGISRDITERKATEAALRESEQRARIALDAARLGLHDYDVQTGLITWDERVREFWGVGPDAQPTYEMWLRGLHPDDRARAEAEVAAALDPLGGGDYACTYRVVDRSTGAIRWVSATGLVQFSGGKPARLIGTALDITEQVKAEERQKLLLAELNHRVKNTLATVQSLAMQTLRNSPNLKAFKENFESRLIALAKTHDVLTRSHWEGARLKDVLEEELAPYRSTSGHIHLEGGPLDLAPPLALSLGLVVHELATNAAKYGALSTGTGSLHVAWNIEMRDGRAWVRVSWREAGGPKVTKPARSGFGMTLLARSIEDELGGETAMDFHEDGLRCNFAFPLDT